MAAADHIHPEQLRLFMRPGDIKATVTDSTDLMGVPATPAHMDVLWETKEYESRGDRIGTNLAGKPIPHGAGLYEALHEAQVYEPIQIITRRNKPVAQSKMYEGHHRVAAAHAVEREGGPTHWIPVTYQGY